jgi:hypothetical protein
MKTITLSLELAKEMYLSGNEQLKKLALENYSKEELEKAQRPNTVLGMPLANTFYVGTASYVEKIRSITSTGGVDCNSWNTHEEAEACLALAQLTRLRDAWNGELLHEWCDWSNDYYKYTVYFCGNKIKSGVSSQISQPLAFKTSELAQAFIADPEILKLINQAKPLL